LTQIRGAGSDGEHPHIVFGAVQSLSVVHSLKQLQWPIPGPPHPQ
jgi:hypothetical protein